MTEDKKMSDNPWGLDETKPEISEEGAGEGIYKENESQNQGEYHQPAGENNQGYWQNDNNQNAYQGNFDQQTYHSQEPYQPVSQGFGIASMVLGILSLVLFCSCVNIILAVVAIIFGIIQLSTPGSKKGMAIAGLITSALSILLFIIFSVVFAVSADFQEGFERGFQNGLRGDSPNQYHYESDLPDYDDEDDYYNDFYDDFLDHDDTF